MPRKPANRTRRKGTRAKAQVSAAVNVSPHQQPAPKLTVRHYCQGIGDSHLLTFSKPDGSPFRMLIDCGVHSSVSGGSKLIQAIAADIKEACGGKLDVLVVTHEHWDHVSGFLYAAEIFKTISVGEVWMAWSENPGDPDAVALDKFKGAAITALQGASRRLDAETAEEKGFVAGLRDGMQSLLGFQFGAAGERVRAARDAASGLSKKQPPSYFGPETQPFIIPGLTNVRVYVLGPPRDRKALRLEEKASEMYPLAERLTASLAATEGPADGGGDSLSPFESHIGEPLSGAISGNLASTITEFVQAHYVKSLPATGPKPRIDDVVVRDQSWRRIDADWLGVAADLAMQLDRGVNNTSLVLAFELVDSGRVFLFPGDAQIGNWLSWQDSSWEVGGSTVHAADLLGRTVFLKVAHHGSQNATPMAKGLSMMTNPDLSAFIPTNKGDATKVHWGDMPYDTIVADLEAKTGKRVVRADDAWLADKNGKPGFQVPSGSIRSVKHGVRDPAFGSGGLWVEVELA
ncbi:MBL fold metallo-hydrolase [Hoeflea sp. AS60]|uniref:MBL fold metallo-hydrolase n=1 Tax=Hoeflea sp. AS60 TaxID=3135780 RepID=UPI00317869AD